MTLFCAIAAVLMVSFVFLVSTWRQYEHHDVIFASFSAQSVNKTFELNNSRLVDAFQNEGVVYITVADGTYEEALRNHVALFTAHHLSGRLIIVCLDDVCHEQCEHKRIYHISCLGSGMQHVANAKLTVIRDVLVAGYPLLFFDADVFFLKHPLTGLGLDDTVDMEFQTDGGISSLNFGYFYASPSKSTLQFWQDVHETWLINQAWDQQIVNELYHNEEYMEHWGIKIKVDTHQVYRNLMLDDHEKLCSDAMASDLFLQRAVMLHMTCTGPGATLKIWVAKVLGAWFDTEGYYSSFLSNHRILTVPSLEIDLRHLVDQSNHMLQIESIMQGLTGSWHFMPPPSVHVSAENFSEDLPFHFVYDIEELSPRMNIVEPFYLHHWQMWQLHNGSNAVVRQQLPAQSVLEVEPGTSMSQLAVLADEAEAIINLHDFMHVTTVSTESASPPFRLCANMMQKERECLRICDKV